MNMGNTSTARVFGMISNFYADSLESVTKRWCRSANGSHEKVALNTSQQDYNNGDFNKVDHADRAAHTTNYKRRSPN